MNSSKFFLGDGSRVTIYNSEFNTIVGDYSVSITRDKAFGYIKDCYNYFLSDHLDINDEVSIIHLGTGLGYDLLHVNDLFKDKKRKIKNITGVDFTDYGDLRVSEKMFDYPIKFYNMDVMKYLNKTKFNKRLDYKTIVFIDLFLKGNTPIDLVYDKELYKNIVNKINPNYRRE